MGSRSIELILNKSIGAAGVTAPAAPELELYKGDPMDWAWPCHAVFPISVIPTGHYFYIVHIPAIIACAPIHPKVKAQADGITPYNS
jgi:hypothetical protein